MDEEEDLFGSSEESPRAPPANDDEEDDEGLFGSDDEEEGGVRRESKKLRAVKRSQLDDDDDDNENIGAEGEAPSSQANTKDEFDDLFGEGKSKAKTRSTGTLSITATTTIPETSKAILMRMPNVVKIQEEPFVESTYDAESDQRSLGKMATGIRWRVKRDGEGNVVMGPDGKPEVESNARLIKLKRGGYQIIVGNNVYECLDHSLANSFLYMQKISTVAEDRKTALEMVGAIDSRMTLQPQSITDKSRSLIGKVLKEENKKVKRIETIKIQDDIMKERPEERMSRFEKEQDTNIRALKKQRMSDGGGYQSSSRIRMSADYLNADDDTMYDNINLSDIKKGRAQKPKRRTNDDSEEDSDDDDDDDGDDLDGFIVKGKDDDDEDEDDGPRYFRKDGKKQPKKPKAEKAKRPSRSSKADLEDPEMEVDDEEEEEADDDDEDEEEEDPDLDDEEEVNMAPAPRKEKKEESVVAGAQDRSVDQAPRRKKMVIDDDDEK